MKVLIIFLIGVFQAGAVWANDDQVVEAIQGFMDFATYSEGAITPEQIQGAGLSEFLFIDARAKEQYETSHIPGALNIEWRQILLHRDRIPADKSIVLYCDTGLLSSKAHLALRLAGYDENVKVMFGGYNNWKKTQKGTE